MVTTVQSWDLRHPGLKTGLVPISCRFLRPCWGKRGTNAGRTPWMSVYLASQGQGGLNPVGQVKMRPGYKEELA